MTDTLGERIQFKRDMALTAGDTARDEAIAAAMDMARDYTDDVKRFLQNWSQNYCDNLKSVVSGQISQLKNYVDTTAKNQLKNYVDSRIAKLAVDNSLINNP